MEPCPCPASPVHCGARCRSRDISACPLVPLVTTPGHPRPWHLSRMPRPGHTRPGQGGPCKTHPPQRLLAWLPVCSKSRTGRAGRWQGGGSVAPGGPGLGQNWVLGPSQRQGSWAVLRAAMQTHPTVPASTSASPDTIVAPKHPQCRYHPSARLCQHGQTGFCSLGHLRMMCLLRSFTPSPSLPPSCLPSLPPSTFHPSFPSQRGHHWVPVALPSS